MLSILIGIAAFGLLCLLTGTGFRQSERQVAVRDDYYRYSIVHRYEWQTIKNGAAEYWSLAGLALIAAFVSFIAANILWNVGKGEDDMKLKSEVHALKSLDVAEEAESSSSGFYLLIAGGYDEESGIESKAKFIEEVQPGKYQMQEVDAHDILLTESGEKATITRSVWEGVPTREAWAGYWFTYLSPESVRAHRDAPLDEINVPVGTILEKFNVNG